MNTMRRRRGRKLSVRKLSVGQDRRQSSPNPKLGFGPSERLAAGYLLAKVRLDDPDIKAMCYWVPIVGKYHAADVQPTQSCLCSHRTPKCERSGRIRQLVGLINQKDRLTIYATVAGIGEGGEQRLEMRLVIATAGVGLLDQNAVRRAVPNATPSLVRPAQSKRKIRGAGMQHHVRLIMPAKHRLRLRRVCPLGKTLSPPLVVLRYRMKLRQI
jgi:hypothetical protein